MDDNTKLILEAINGLAEQMHERFTLVAGQLAQYDEKLDAIEKQATYIAALSEGSKDSLVRLNARLMAVEDVLNIKRDQAGRPN